jgi:hypothetical protein
MESQYNWKEELKITSANYHTIGSWVALVINFFWFISDYFIIPDHFQDFLIFRIFITILILAVIWAKDKLEPALIGFIPVLGLVFQNAYMYSVMELPAFRNHTYGYVALFIGMGLLVLWEYKYTIAVIVFTLVSNTAFFSIYSPLNLNEILVNGGMLATAVAICTIALVQTRYNLTKKELQSRIALSKSNDQLARQKKIIEEKNRDITDSINYAKNIQEAILPNQGEIEKVLKDHFIFYKPKDIVSGDFYWFANKGKVSFIAACDCTGHGVPGGFVSMIGNDLLNQIIIQEDNNDPGQILTLLNKGVKSVFTKEGGQEAQDGMDMALCTFEQNGESGEINRIRYAGAYNPIYIVREGIGSSFPTGNGSNLSNFGENLLEIKADKACIGGNTKLGFGFKSHTFNVKKGDCIYLFSDGFMDQFGGRRGKKFTKKRFKELLVEINGVCMSEQLDLISQKKIKWMGKLDQLDDMLVLGFRI